MMDPVRGFQAGLQDYVARLGESASHDARRFIFLAWARDTFGIDFARLETEKQVYRGRVDALLGNLVFEFKRDLERERADAESQLARYIADLSARHPGAAYTGVATDGLRFRLYMPIFDGGALTRLQPIGELDLQKEPDAEAAFLWMDALFSHFREGKTTPTARNMVAGLGPASPVFRQTFHVLLSLYREVKDEPEVQVRFREWQSYLSIVYGESVGDQELFVKHTYLSILARLIALYHLQPNAFLPSREDHIKVINGVYFRDRDIYNFGEEDFFTWTLNSKVLDDSLELVRRLINTLAAYDFTRAGQDLLKGLYQELVDPEARHDLGEYYTPDWLAEYILSEELKLQENPNLSVLDPACGSGTFLFTAIRLIRDGMARRGEDEFDTLLHILNSVMGVDVHPVAVAIARTNYLLALGDLISGPHPPVLVPVYLANAIQLPNVSTQEPQRVDESTAQLTFSGGYEEAIHVIETTEPNVAFELPDSVVDDPTQLDWLFHRLSQYLHAAEFRTGLEGESKATEEVINSLYSYLTSPKRAGLRELPPLSPFAAEVLCRTARTLIRLVLEGKDTVWLDILKNGPAPVFLSRRKFDLVVGNPPWLPMGSIRNHNYYQFVKRQVLREYRLLERGETHLFTHMELADLFFARSADLYLRDGGSIAFVMPRAVMTAEQHSHFTSFSFKGGSLALHLDKILDLDKVEPLFNVPSCVLMARKGEETKYPVEGLVFEGNPPSRNASLEDTTPDLKLTTTLFQRTTSGKLLVEGTAALPEGKSYYADKFYQGATIVPRNMWFVQIRSGPLGFNPARPPVETDEETARNAKKPWDTIRMQGNIEAEFLYATLLGHDLVPFGYTRLRPIVLPVLRQGDRLTLLNWQRAVEMGYFGLGEWVRRAEEEWAGKGRRDDQGQLRIPNVIQQIDYRRKLTRQNMTVGYKVLFNRSSTNLLSLVLDTRTMLTIIEGSDMPILGGFLCDNAAYMYETEIEAEAHYLSAVLNSPTVDTLIKTSQTRGLFGERDIHKRPLQLPIPRFDPANADHDRLAELSQECHRKVSEVLPQIAARYRSIGKMRSEVRRLVQSQLEEIDGLVQRLLQIR